jgi:putative Holliday junction resolvase
MTNAALGRFLGVDYGEKRVGLSIADPLGMIASPAGYIHRREGKRPPIAAIIKKVAELEARGFLLGLPQDEEGKDTAWTTAIRELGAELEKRTGLPVSFLDESFTTSDALATIRHLGGSPRGRKGDVAAMAATILLQRALDEPD